MPMPTWCFSEYNSCFGKLKNYKRFNSMAREIRWHW